MKPIEGYQLITPGDLSWRPSNLMRIPNADYLERTGSEILGARLWRLPPKSANTLHKHVRAEEFYFVLEGIGRMRVGEEALQFRAMAVFSSDRRFYGRYLMIQTPRFSGLSSERRTRKLTRGRST